MAVSGRTVLLGAAAAGAVYAVGSRLYEWWRTCALRLAVAEQRGRRDQSIRLTIEQYELTPADVRARVLALGYGELCRQLRARLVSCRQVLHAYQEQAVKTHVRTNCVAEFIVEADAAARRLDKEVQALTDEQLQHKYPLLGIPFSVKESISYEGYRSTSGFAARLNTLCAQSSLTVQLLEESGAVAFVRTNVPQTLFSFGCSNPVYGRTLNPHNVTRSCGGSSGGDACLVGAKAAVFGMGTDIAGSIRLPAHFSGTFGIKPTSLRLSAMNLGVCNPGRAFIFGATGPLAIEAQVLTDVMAALCTADMYARDGTIPWQPWQGTPQQPGKRRLRVGVIKSLPDVPAAPSLQRAIALVETAVQHSLADSVELVEWQVPHVDKCFQWTLAAAMTDAAHHLLELVFNDIPNEDDLTFFNRLAMNPTLRHVHLSLINDAASRDVYAALPADTRQLRAMYAQLASYKRQVVDLWQQAGLDALLLPPCASVAVHPELQMQMFNIFSYTALFNLVDFPAAVLPVTTVQADDVRAFNTEWTAASKLDALMARCNGTDESIGLPVGAQLVALPYREELLLHLLNDIQAALSTGQST